uniref:F-box domain-containing protein n=1 Tax=Strigamia maritima TaxID=126957 RepID=T1J126_STRMM
MPRYRMPRSLQSHCYPVLVQLLWNWWLNSKDEHTAQVDRILRYFQIPYPFTGKILELLDEKHTVFTGHLLLLLKTKLTYLDLSRSRVAHEVLVATPKLIPNISTLRLQFTTCQDDVVAAISSHCAVLENLDISYCSVTDLGTTYLSSLTSQCRSSLKSLNITDTKVTVNGAVLVLDQLPNLRELECHEMIDVLSLVYNTYPDRVYDLRAFQFGSERRSNRAYESNQILVSHCYNIASEILPFLNNIIINDWNPRSSDGLRPICNYNCLSSLELDVQFCPFLTMVDVMPILATRGMQLVELVLKQVQSVDSVVLIDSCPNLLTLELEHNTYVDSEIEPLLFFRELKNLILVGNIPARILTVLIGYSPIVEYLDVHHSYNFTAEVIQEVVERNPLGALVEVWFLECDFFTDDALQILIASAKELQKMSVEYCRVSIKQRNKLRKWIKSNYPCIDLELQVQSRIW